MCNRQGSGRTSEALHLGTESRLGRIDLVSSDGSDTEEREDAQLTMPFSGRVVGSRGKGRLSW